MSLLNQLERVLGRLAVPNLALIIVAGQVLFWGLASMGGFNLEPVALRPAAVLAGQPWRLITFVFLPPYLGTAMFSLVMMAFGWYLFYLMGGALETFWGVFRFNLFIGLAWLLSVAVSFATPELYATNVYLLGSVFLAFAFLNPDFTLLVFFILPVKIKWLALIQWLGYAYLCAVGTWSDRLLVLAATGNFLVFFTGDIVERIRTGRRRMAHQARMAGVRREAGEPRHRCRICGRTDLSDPQLDFRYCSKCAGNECYCSDHIFAHEHVLVDESAKR